MNTLFIKIILCSLFIILYGCFGGKKNNKNIKEELINENELVQLDSLKGYNDDSFFDSSQIPNLKILGIPYLDLT